MICVINNNNKIKIKYRCKIVMFEIPKENRIALSFVVIYIRYSRCDDI